MSGNGYISLNRWPKGPAEASKHHRFLPSLLSTTRGKEPITEDDTYLCLQTQRSRAGASLEVSSLPNSIYGAGRYSANYQRKVIIIITQLQTPDLREVW